MKPTALEQAIVDLLLLGDHPALDVLRRQWATAEITNRAMSGVGCFVAIGVPTGAPILSTDRRITFGDVVVDLADREAAIGGVLFVDQGVLAMLELFTFDGSWPEETDDFALRYTSAPRVLLQLEGLSWSADS